jgi:hypothetical protein
MNGFVSRAIGIRGTDNRIEQEPSSAEMPGHAQASIDGVVCLAPEVLDCHRYQRRVEKSGDQGADPIARVLEVVRIHPAEHRAAIVGGRGEVGVTGGEEQAFVRKCRAEPTHHGFAQLSSDEHEVNAHKHHWSPILTKHEGVDFQRVGDTLQHVRTETGSRQGHRCLGRDVRRTGAGVRLHVGEASSKGRWSMDAGGVNYDAGKLAGQEPAQHGFLPGDLQ